MENNEIQGNTMESAAHNDRMNISFVGSKFPSSKTSYTANLNYVMLDMTSQPFLHFHENIISDYICENPIEKRMATINNVKAQLIEELHNIKLLENQVQDLLNRYQQFKKS